MNCRETWRGPLAGKNRDYREAWDGMRRQQNRQFAILLLLAGLVAVVVFFASVADAAAPSCLTNSFNAASPPNPCTIKLLPDVGNGLNVYAYGASITISNTGGATSFEVYDSNCTKVWSGTTPATTNGLAANHYYILSGSDRSAFYVHPAGQGTISWLGTDTGSDADSTQRVEAAKLGIVRDTLGNRWEKVVTNDAAPWTWSEGDAMVNAYSNKFLVVTVAYPRPTWQTNDATFMADYTNFVAQLVARQGTKVSAFEPVNEWYYPGASGIPDPWLTNTATATAHAYDYVKATNPSAEIWSPGFVNYTDYRNHFGPLKDLISNKLERVVWHDYDTDRFKPDEYTAPVSNLWTRINHLKLIFGTNALLASSEAGWYGTSSLGTTNTGPASDPLIDYVTGQRRALKNVLMQKALGVPYFVPHQFLSGGAGTDPAGGNIEYYGVEYGRRGPHVRTSAILRLANRLSGYTPVSITNVASAWFTTWVSGSTTQRIDWALEGTTTNTTQATAVDVFGNSYGGVLTAEPRFFTEAAAPAQQTWVEP